MVYVKLRQSGASSVLVFHIAVILTQMYSCRGESQVIGPLHPIVALIGEDIILPCYLKPVLNAFAMTVEWARPDLNPRFVLVWRDGLELESEKNPLYSSRTSLFTDELKHGNISLKLSSVKLSDQGTYSCFVPDLDRDSRIQLVAGAASSLVNISEISRNSSAVELECESAGWYPEPEVLWLDGEGNLLSAGPTETVRGPDGLYAVSSRVTVEKRHSNKLTCRVQQNNIKQSRETWIHVPDDFVTDPPPPSPSSSSVAAIIGLIVAIMLTLAVVFFVWKWRQIKLEKMQNQKTNSSGGNDALIESLIERKAAENVEQNPKSERTGSNIQIEDETHQSQTNNHLIQTQEETEKQSGHEGAEVQPSVDRGRQIDQPLETMSHSDKDQEDTANSENSPVERDVNNEGDETEAGRENTDSVMDEERQQEQLIGKRNSENNLQAQGGEKNLQEVQSDLNKEMEKQTSKPQAKEKDEGEYEKRVARLMGKKTNQEEQIKDLKEQLEEVERKLQLKKETEETQTEEDEKDLEKKKEEVQKKLDRLEKALEKSIKEADVMIQRKMKATKEKEEMINKLEMNRSENQSESDEDL